MTSIVVSSPRGRHAKLVEPACGPLALAIAAPR
jgi:hypothetical protein